MSENATMFSSITGAPPDQAAMYLEMAGGDVETAISIFFANQDGGDAPMETTDAAAAAAASVDAPMTGPAPAWWNAIWPAVETPPEAWTQQKLDSGDGWQGGLPQPMNGPCGVLAVVHGLVLAAQHERAVADIKASKEAIADAIGVILSRCRPDDCAPIRLVRPRERGNYSPDAELEESEFADSTAAAAEIRARIDNFCGPGGIVDFVYSAVLTHGVGLVRQEALAEGGELPLVTKAFNCWLCTTELLSLLLRGTAKGNVGNFAADGKRNESWEGAAVGILSRSEKETGIPIADALKTPKAPVWILHGGDHFTVAWANSMPSTEAGTNFTLNFWNGLPPGGPRRAEMAIVATKGATASGSKEAPKFYKPAPGEIDDVVQADPEDKKAHPDQYRKWHFEVLLARDDPTVQGETRPPDMKPEPIFDNEDPRYQRPGPWRCRLCYEKRFQTMDFNLISDSPDWCPKCEKPRKECGWSMWIPFADLPPGFQGTIMDRHAKKIETILWTKWPAAEVTVAEGSLPDC